MPKDARVKKGATDIIIGADHAGFIAKERLKLFFSKKNLSVADCGAYDLDKSDDYPEIAFRVAREVARTKTRGILLCGSGQGVSIAANKIGGIRAAIAWNEESAKTARNDDDANILCLPARLLSFAQLERITDAWLHTPFSGLARHRRRVKQIESYNQKR